MKDESGKALSGVFAAAAVAGAIACGADPAVPLNGAELYGIGGLQSVYSDNDIDLLVQGGVTPLEEDVYKRQGRGGTDATVLCRAGGSPVQRPGQ